MSQTAQEALIYWKHCQHLRLNSYDSKYAANALCDLDMLTEYTESARLRERCIAVSEEISVSRLRMWTSA